MSRRTPWRAAGVAAVTAALIAAPLSAAQAYSPAGGIVYQVPAGQACLKGSGNCAIYGKMAQLPSGRLVMSFEQSTVVAASGSADGQTLPIYVSDDYGDTWQRHAEVAAPAYLSEDPRYAPYVSNWTNPNLYVLPEPVGDLEVGTLLLASVVSGDDEFYLENKQRDPSWVPDNDGDRSDVSIALFASHDEGGTWEVVNIIAEGGWQGGSAGAGGRNIAAANVHRQQDPLWEPHLIVHDGRLVAFYSDENDHLPFDPATGAANVDPQNDTAPDSGGQVLAHRTWDGSSAAWSEPVIDVPGITVDAPSGRQQIGGGRPGMTYVAPTTDDRWMLTFEYFGGGDNARVAFADDPTRFHSVTGTAGRGVTELPASSGSGRLATGGSPVTELLPDGRIVYNAAGSGDVWVNKSGRSDGEWTQYGMPVPGGYSRALQFVEGTGRVITSQSAWGGAGSTAVIRHAEVDLGDSVGTYYRFVNRATGQVLGTGGLVNDARFNSWTPDVRLEAASDDDDSQYWRLVEKSDGTHVLLNKSGGRHASVWGGTATPGQRVAQWVDEYATGTWNVVEADDSSMRLQAVSDPMLYATGAPMPINGVQSVTTEPLRSDGSQEWELEPLVPGADELPTDPDLIAEETVTAGGTVTLHAASFTPAGEPRRANVRGLAFIYTDNAVRELGPVEFDTEQRGTVALPASLEDGASVRLGVLFDDTAPVSDAATVVAAAVEPEPEPEPQPGGPGAGTDGEIPPPATGTDAEPASSARDALERTGADPAAPLLAALAALALGVGLLHRRRRRAGRP